MVVARQSGPHQVYDRLQGCLYALFLLRQILYILPVDRIFHIHEKEIAVPAVGKIRHSAFVDAVGIGDDPAPGSLTENAREADNGKAVRLNEIAQNIACSDTGQLIDITDKNKRHCIRDCFYQVIEKEQIDHGTLVHDQNIALKRVFFIFLISIRRLHFQKPVNSLRLHARRLGEALGGSPRRRGKKDPCASTAKGCNDPQSSGCLARSGSACQDQYLTADRSQNRLNLHLVILHPGPLFYAGGKSFLRNSNAFRVPVDFCHAPDDACLGKEKGRKIDRSLLC